MAKAERLIWLVVDVAIFFAISGMVGLIALQVTSRLAGDSVPWTEELARFLFIWTIWLGMAAGFRRGHHPSINILTGILPDLAQDALRLLPPLCAALFFGLVGWHGVGLLRQQLRFGEVSPILQVGMWVATAPLIIGAILSVIGAVLHAVEAGRGARLGGATEA